MKTLWCFCCLVCFPLYMQAQLIWEQDLEMPLGDFERINIQETASGGYFINGAGKINDSTHLFMMKLDADRNKLWEHTYPLPMQPAYDDPYYGTRVFCAYEDSLLLQAIIYQPDGTFLLYTWLCDAQGNIMNQKVEQKEEVAYAFITITTFDVPVFENINSSLYGDFFTTKGFFKISQEGEFIQITKIGAQGGTVWTQNFSEKCIYKSYQKTAYNGGFAIKADLLTENDTIPINIQYDAAGNLMWWEKLYVDELPLFLEYKSVSITPYQATCIEDIDIYFRKKLIGNSYGINIGIECLTTPYLYIYNEYWRRTLSNGTMLLISRNTAKETLVSIACPYKAIPSAGDLKDSGDFKEITKGIIAYKKFSPSPSLPLLRWSLREQMYKFSIPAGSKHTLRVDTIGADVKKIVGAPDSVSINLLGYRYSEQAVLDSLVFENNYPESNDFYVKLYQHRDSIQRDSSTWYRPFYKSYRLENLPDGVYTIHLLNNDEEIKTSVFTVSEQPLVPQVSTYNYAENPEPNLYQYCKEFMPDTLYAQGTNIKWYEMLADSTYALLAEGNTYFPTSNDQIIYVSQTTALGYESEKLAITLEPLPPPNLGGGYFNLYEKPGSCDVTFGYNCLYCSTYCVDDEFPFVLQVGLQSIKFYKDGVPISAPYVGNQYDYNYACLCLGHCNYYATKGNGVYTIEFHLKNEYGCENVIAHDFNVITYPDIDKKVTVCTDDPAIELVGENLSWYDSSGATLLGQGNTFEIYSPGFYQVSQTVNGVEGPKCKFEATLQSPNYDPFNPNDCYKQQLADIATGGTSSIGNISIGDAAVTFPPTTPNYADMTKEDGGGKQGSLASVPTSRRFSIVPNPVEDVAILRLPADMEVELRLWSAAGKLLWEQQKATDGERITMADLAAGVYYVELRSASGVYSMKLVKIDK